MRKKILDLDIGGLARLFGATTGEIKKYCGHELASMNFRYHILSGKERDRVIIDILERLNSRTLSPAGEKRRRDWEDGWGENLKEFIGSGYSIDKLIPKYFKKSVPARLNNEYIVSCCEDFVFNVSHIFRTWLFRKYFQDIDCIYEFGCGSAWHLALLAALFPKKKIFGFDWAKSSQKIIASLSSTYGWSITGGYFDFFHPDRNINFSPNSGVLTFGALEQVGNKYEPYLQFILKKSPKICVDVAGFCELYDKKSLTGFLALEYHRSRNYLDAYLTRLKELDRGGRIKILKIHHQPFGNLFDDPHSYVVWTPKKKGTS